MTDQLDALPSNVQRAWRKIDYATPDVNGTCIAPTAALETIFRDHVRLIALVRVLERELQPARYRWNVERDGEVLRVCRNGHDKGDACEWETFVPVARAEKAEARVQELERENGECRRNERDAIRRIAEQRERAETSERRLERSVQDIAEWRPRALTAEAELAEIKRRIAEAATATLRITYEEDRAMGVYLRDMDIGTLCWLDGECVALLPLDEAKS